MRTAAVAILIGIAASTALVQRTHAQPPAASTPLPTPANLTELMRGTFYPSSNIVFAAQDLDPETVPHAKDPSMATDLLTSTFGKWEAVENSALAMAELANLLTLPGRKCANGVDVPVSSPDWVKFVQELRDAGMSAYAAAKSKNQEKIFDATGVLSDACFHCHAKFRQRRPADHCK